MLLALDLNARQTARFLAQAVSTRAHVEIEPRPETCDALLWGTVVGGESNLINVDLHDGGKDVPLTRLVGATCDARTILSEQLYLFSTFVLDVVENAVPQRLVLATPEFVQVANRRRMVRKAPDEPVPVRLVIPGAAQPFVGELVNIGEGGMGCRVAAGEPDGLLFIGDQVQVEFALPWAADIYTLQVTVCGKTPCPDKVRVNVGFEFLTHDPDGGAALDRLRAALNHETARLSDMNGEL